MCDVQVFGRLIDRLDRKSPDTLDSQAADSDPDLKEHMVGILFSRSGKLSHLQKQVHNEWWIATFHGLPYTCN